MKRIVVYNASWSTFGGGEKYACALAAALASNTAAEVSLLADIPHLRRERLEEYFHLDLGRVDVPVLTRRQVRTRLAEADFGVIISNFRPYRRAAGRTAYVLQIPYGPITPLTIGRKLLRGKFKDGMKDIFRKRLLRLARQADCTIVYSEFVREVLERNHQINAQVLAPPIDDFAGTRERRNVILSVGRFFTGPYNDKRYDVMIDAFKQLSVRLVDKRWEYRIVGSCADDESSRRHLARLRAAAAGYPVVFSVNSPYEDLRRHYQESSIFWHAAGFGIDERHAPDRLEHFGMSTVEAMSAGCIPVVINAGGQKEIVRHGASGYLWRTPEELIGFTHAVMDDPAAAAALRRGARARYEEYAGAHFPVHVRSLMQQKGIIPDASD